jgi:hypothetical protein
VQLPAAPRHTAEGDQGELPQAPGEE